MFVVSVCLRVSVALCLQVKAATGEEVSAEDLGGADLHCKYEITVFLITLHVWVFNLQKCCSPAKKSLGCCSKSPLN